MADLGSALHARLAAAPEIAAIVVSGSTKRIYPVAVPQNAGLPYVRYQTISDPRPEYLQGYQGMRRTRVQVDCFAKKYLGARNLAEAVIAATSESGVEVAGVRFGRIKAEGPEDLGEDVEGVGFVHRARLDLLIWHNGD